MNRSGTYDAGWGTTRAPFAGEAVRSEAEMEGQYSLFKILAIWAAAVVPMVVLGWVVAPLIGDRVDLGVGDENREGIMRALLLTVGLVWQFVLAMGIVFHEEGNIWPATIKRRCWLNAPRDPKTGEKRGKLWLWIIPFALGFTVIQFAPLAEVWNAVFPFLGEPDKYSFAKLMESDDRKAALEGAWQILAIFAVLGIFNTILGEELLFRGVLLPKMRGRFGKGDWAANGLLFGLYHLHQPWGIAHAILDGMFTLAWPSRRYRSAWMGILAHSTQTVFFMVMALGLYFGAM